jgi:hypothetical protein
MDGRQDPLSDAALDRELEAALNVEPSPEFVARVRMHVADQSLNAGWWPRWRLVAAGIGAVTVAVGTAFWSMDGNVGAAFRRPEPSSTVKLIAGDVVLPAAVVELAPAPAAAPTEPRIRAAVASSSRPRARVATGAGGISLDDVIVAAEDRLGFEALLVALEERRLPALPRTDEDGNVESSAPAPIEIPDVTIEPLELVRLE